MAIAYLEKPKGCLKTLRLLDRKGEITIRELMRETSLSQNGAYSSLDHLAGLGVVESPTESTIRGASKKYKPTREGEELLRLVSVFFDLLELVSRRENIDPYLETPYRSWEILLRTYRDGRVSLTILYQPTEYPTDLIQSYMFSKTAARTGSTIIIQLSLIHHLYSCNDVHCKKTRSYLGVLLWNRRSHNASHPLRGSVYPYWHFRNMTLSFLHRPA